MWRHVDIVLTNVSEERIVAIFRVLSVNTISTWRQIPEDGILHSHCRENLKSCKATFVPCTSLYILSEFLHLIKRLQFTIMKKRQKIQLSLGLQFLIGYSIVYCKFSEENIIEETLVLCY
jgi:hypothetical protein